MLSLNTTTCEEAELHASSMADIDDVTFDVIEEASKWQRCHRQIQDIERLTSGWDDAGAPPVSRALISSVWRVLQEFERHGFHTPTRISPTRAGTVCIEWQLRSYIELEVVDGALEWLVQLPDGKIEQWRTEVETDSPTIEASSGSLSDEFRAA